MFHSVNERVALTESDGTAWTATNTGASGWVDCRKASWAQINVVIATTGSVQVEVANRDTNGDATPFGAAFTASGNLTIDPAWAYFRVNVSANGSTVTADYRLGEARH